MVWAILKISYNPLTNKAEGGICGSAFFITRRNFISAHHCFNEMTFRPNEGFPKVKVFLANDRGKIIQGIQIKRLVPEYDLAVGEVDRYYGSIEICKIGHRFNTGDLVQNIGYPKRGLIKCELRMIGSDLVVRKISLKKEIQDGKIEAVMKVDINARDVQIKHKELIMLSYSSEVGFSGGPLLLKNSREVIGMMSLVIPEDINPKRPAMAIKLNDVLQFLPREN